MVQCPNCLKEYSDDELNQELDNQDHPGGEFEFECYDCEFNIQVSVWYQPCFDQDNPCGNIECKDNYYNKAKELQDDLDKFAFIRKCVSGKGFCKDWKDVQFYQVKDDGIYLNHSMELSVKNFKKIFENFDVIESYLNDDRFIIESICFKDGNKLIIEKKRKDDGNEFICLFQENKNKVKLEKWLEK